MPPTRLWRNGSGHRLRSDGRHWSRRVSLLPGHAAPRWSERPTTQQRPRRVAPGIFPAFAQRRRVRVDLFICPPRAATGTVTGSRAAWSRACRSSRTHAAATFATMVPSPRRPKNSASCSNWARRRRRGASLMSLAFVEGQVDTVFSEGLGGRASRGVEMVSELPSSIPSPVPPPYPVPSPGPKPRKAGPEPVPSLRFARFSGQFGNSQVGVSSEQDISGVDRASSKRVGTEPPCCPLASSGRRLAT